MDISNITTTSRDTILINIEKFQKGCQKLKVLNANHTMLSLSDTPIKEQVHSPGFPHLQELYIAVDSRGYFDGMDDSQIERILKKSANLRLLDIRGCQHVTESCLIRLPTWDLERLVVAGCSAAAEGFDGLELVVKKWANKLVDIDIGLTTGRAVNNAIDAFAESDDVQLRYVAATFVRNILKLFYSKALVKKSILFGIKIILLHNYFRTSISKIIYLDFIFLSTKKEIIVFNILVANCCLIAIAD